jgi:Arc/MetJ family transcription regulator
LRTNIDIDDELLVAAMTALGTKSKKATVEEALRRVTGHQRLKDFIEETRGIGWVGDLDAMREGRAFAEEDVPYDGKK